MSQPPHEYPKEPPKGWVGPWPPQVQPPRQTGSYQIPPQQQQTGQWQQPPQGYYQQPPPQYYVAGAQQAMQPAKKKGMSGWAIFGLIVAGLFVIGTISNAINPKSTATSTPTAGVASAPTQAAVSGQSQPQPIATSVPRPTQPPASSNQSIVLAPNSQFGKELIGQTATTSDLKATVTGVEHISELKNSKGDSIKPQGAFLVVTFEIENIGKQSTMLLFAALVDNKGRRFSGTTGTEALGAITFSGRYKTDLTVQPGTKGKDYKLFELPLDATNLKLEVGFAPSSSSSSNAPKTGKIGETVAQDGYLITVNGVERAESFGAGGKAKDGNIMVAVDITVGSDKDKGVSSNGLNCNLKDSQGFKYSGAIFGVKNPLLPGQNDIPKGDKVRGWVTFEVPKTATGLTLEYTELFGGVLVKINLE